ncbi:MAG: MotA/TolQ/ExbB proton channel family protein [Pyrinomonadaceae bacterium]
MKSLSRKTLIGIVLVILSPLVGIAGAIWSVYRSFEAMERNESAGIGAVGGEILSALIFTIAGIIGTIVGVLLIVFGIRRASQS